MQKEKRTLDIAYEMFDDIPKGLKKIGKPASEMLDDLPKNLKKIVIPRWFDKLGFAHILLIWASVIILFGLIYHFFMTDTTYLFYNIETGRVYSISDAIYFSFITATSTGFGDILPFGAFKVISIFEVVFGLVLLAFVTSKLVSLKQDVILSELYEISLQEIVNRLRSSLLVFRQNIARITGKMEDKSIKRKDVSDIYAFFASLDITLNEIAPLLQTKDDNHFAKGIDSIDAEVLLNSVLQSFEKISEMMLASRKCTTDIKQSIPKSQLESCISTANKLFDKAQESKILSKNILEELKARKKKIFEELEKEIG